MEESQFNLNCTNFTAEQLKGFNLTRSITAILCTAVIIIILLNFFLSKSYKNSGVQKLYIALIIGSIITEIVHAIGMEHLFQYNGQEKVCKWLGFLDNWTSVMVLILNFEVTLYLLWIVLRIHNFHFKCNLLTKVDCLKKIFKATFVFMPTILALPLALMPLLHDKYGVAGPWCWIRSVNENCSVDGVGLKYQIAYFGLQELIGVIGLIVAVIIYMAFCRGVPAFTVIFQRLMKQTLILTIFQFVYIAIVTFQFINIWFATALMSHHQYEALLFMHAFLIPFGHLILPLGWQFSFFSTKCCRCRHLSYHIIAKNTYFHISAASTSIVINEQQEFRGPTTSINGTIIRFDHDDTCMSREHRGLPSRILDSAHSVSVGVPCPSHTSNTASIPPVTETASTPKLLDHDQLQEDHCNEVVTATKESTMLNKNERLSITTKSDYGTMKPAKITDRDKQLSLNCEYKDDTIVNSTQKSHAEKWEWIEKAPPPQEVSSHSDFDTTQGIITRSTKITSKFESLISQFQSPSMDSSEVKSRRRSNSGTLSSNSGRRKKGSSSANEKSDSNNNSESVSPHLDSGSEQDSVEVSKSSVQHACRLPVSNEQTS